MQVLFIVLNDLSYLDQILNRLVELKVRGATIMDSQGMASAIGNSEGLAFLFSGLFQHSVDDIQKNSKTIFTVIPEDDKVESIVQEIRSIVADSTRKVIGFMFTIPVSGIYPMKPKVH